MRSKTPKAVRCGRSEAGFTLIELLVVVAIVSVLLALLMPTCRTVRILARRTTCQSRLKQITLAWHLYLDDNSQCFYQGDNANHDFGGWQGKGGYALSRPLNPYLKLPLEIETENGAITYRCPADSGGLFNRPPLQMAYHYFGNSYQTNYLLIGPPHPFIPRDERKDFYREINKRLKGLRRDTVSDPCRLLLVGDNNWVTQWDLSQPLGEDWHGRGDYYNLSFLDGHVEFIRIFKDLFVLPKYRVLPFAELDDLVPRSVN